MTFDLKNDIPRVLLIAMIALSPGCDSGKSVLKERYTEYRAMMGTQIRLDVCAGTAGEVIKPDLSETYEEAWSRLEEIAWRMNVYDDKSDVAEVNRSYQNPRQVGADTVEVIEASLYWNEISGGAFDITVWPLIKLWREQAAKGQLPEPVDLARVKASVGPETVRVLDATTVQTTHPDTKIDLGGIAKGYAIDEAASIFRKNGFPDFYIDAGGDVFVGGKNCHGRPWRIGIRDPLHFDRILDIVEVSDQAVTTSGNYEQFFEIGGEKWSHIIDPVSGYPQKDVVSATVIAPEAITADALSTAVTVLGKEAGMNLIQSLGEDVGVMVVLKDETGKLMKFPDDVYLEHRPFHR